MEIKRKIHDIFFFTEERYKLLASIPATLFLMGSFTMLVVSNMLKDR